MFVHTYTAVEPRYTATCQSAIVSCRKLPLNQFAAEFRALPVSTARDEAGTDISRV